MYRVGTKLQYKEYNILLNSGGMGDTIAALPAIKYILDYHKHICMYLFVQDYAVAFVKKIFEGFRNIKVNGMTEYYTEAKDDMWTRSPYSHRISALSSHITDHAFLSIVHKSVENKYKNYLKLEPIEVSEFNLPEKYVVITTGFTAKVREWNAQSVNETVDYVISKGYTPVFVGKSRTKSGPTTSIVGTFKAEYNKPGTINLIDKTDLFQAHAIMASAKAVVGLDNGLLHLACMSDVPVVYALTTLNKEHRLPYRKDELGWNCYPIELKELECSGCQSNFNFAPTTHNFTTCYYGNLNIQCVKMMTSNKFIAELEKIL